MEIVVKAWGDVVAKIKHQNGINHFSLSPENKLNFSPIKLKEKGVDCEFSHLKFQKGLPGMISDSLPGIYGKAYIDEFFMKHLKFKPDYLETLQFLGENTMGALTYSPALKELKKTKKNRTNAIFDAVELYGETKKALIGDANFSINKIIAISNSAASGARPKAIVGFNKETNKMFVGSKYEALPDGFVHSIVKFDNLIYKDVLKDITEKEKASQTKGEYIYYLIARELGINMADSHLVEAQGNCHFVTQRFDVTVEDGGVLRKHMHSLSGLMHHNPAETSFDYTNLFRVGGLLNIPHQDKVQFFKTMLFNLIFGNRDDHSRNFSYLMDSTGNWRGAPAYDLTFTTNKKHQMLFDYTSGYDLKKKHIKEIANAFSIKGSDEMIEQMMDIKHSLLPDLAIQYEMKEWYEQIVNSTDYVLKD
ncbi:HipA domain-containing protein [Sulfurimonas sp. SAG-AH-194-L11]|nr:HipA domain-containing protein [Sulfurimonas sp. SAG-AH-194-L11]MDF1877806.1 HipA domain-containing protein [Sulfurimonas sp. SAG-AH-194-L11]